MAQPNIKINLSNNALGKIALNEDGICGLLVSGYPSLDLAKIQIGKPFVIYSLAQAEALDITSTGLNAFAHKQISDFYSVAKTGSELWIMLFDGEEQTLSQALGTSEAMTQFFADSKGRVKTLGVLKEFEGTEVVSDGLISEVHSAVSPAQALCDAQKEIKQPLTIVLGGSGFTSNVSALKNYKTENFSSVAMLIAGKTSTPAVGLLLGRIAKSPVQRKISRVKDGSVCDVAYFSDGSAVETKADMWDLIHDKGYIFLKSFPGKAGYFFNDDQTLCADTNDYNSLTASGVIGKVLRIVYKTLIEELSDEIYLEESGVIHPAIIKSWEAMVTRALNLQMVATGEISGHLVYIDPDQDVLGNSKLEVSLKVLPVGYSKYIEVEIGYTTSLTNTTN
ncbi:MAG: hypothetical protein C4K58_06915 [Flavobacteriaceae bacterium]|nr:MAG: hypothetical protein C4K58_06915 [Flavobacteriaceae bacterium]